MLRIKYIAKPLMLSNIILTDAIRALEINQIINKY